LVTAPQLVEDLVVQGEELGRPGHQPFALQRERDPAGGSDEERHPELPFKPGDVAAQRLLGDVQAGCGPPEVQFLGHGEEAPEQPGVHVAHEATPLGASAGGPTLESAGRSGSEV
jgi:hypothetical protein